MKKAFIKIIRSYQKHISRNTAPKCRFFPTCSNYAVEAIETWGVFRGTLLALWRILRCNPFSKGGFDPVPERKEKHRKR